METDDDEDFPEFGQCYCGANLIPIWDEWWDGDKKIRGVSVFRCPSCLRDHPAPPDFDRVIERR